MVKSLRSSWINIEWKLDNLSTTAHEIRGQLESASKMEGGGFLHHQNNGIGGAKSLHPTCPASVILKKTGRIITAACT
jgi:hypothetical protein